jgi:hypothetical protein
LPGKKKSLKKKKNFQNTEMHVEHKKHAYVHGFYTMQTVYAREIYRGQGVYASANFQKIKRFGWITRHGRLVGTWKVTRDPRETPQWSHQLFYGENPPILSLR